MRKDLRLTILVVVLAVVEFVWLRQRPVQQVFVNDQLDINHPLAFATVQGHPIIAKCSERIVEVPFVHRSLPYPFRGRLLDVGCRESEMTFETSCLGFETWGIDIRPQLVAFPGLHYVQGDICQYRFPEEFFDVVIALSTVEHIGLMAYENTRSDREGDLHALQAIRRILKPQGRLILTVPFGVRGATNWYRVYDHEALQRLLRGAGFNVQTEDYWYQDGFQWIPAPWEKAEKTDSLSYGARGVACILAYPGAKPAKQLAP